MTTQYLPPPRPGAHEDAFPTAEPETAGAHPPRDSDPARATDGDTHRRWSRTSVGVLTATAALLAGALVTHLVMTFLSLAPPNALRIGNQRTINAYLEPEFQQNWKLFAPDPLQRNAAVGVRLRTTADDGTAHISEWINLTAQDLDEIKGDPAPSHAHQNMLRNAWDNSENWHGPNDLPKGIRGKVAVAYLKRVALQRVGRQWEGERITAVQLAGRYSKVSPPSWSSEEPSDTTTYQVRPWWPVTDQDYKGL
ncbi:DUF5819 family protein [Streptomyces sp. CA-210063]|uniref:DUF5819 family protein n=1 Tax=Streptomyces sp. CA-210063 TaxID=2801029 RepID=UPI00214B5E7D|nr:DUF5819 family protein [Streptomyces sp. CA-210063]UUU31516.1 DUF5819 family protein [Streptomyces sp. CA-210063]